MEPRQTLYPNNGHKSEVGPSADQVMLEGMKVLFDDKVGLYPVILVANIVLCIVAALAASRGQWYRYPMTLRLIT